MMPTPFIMKLPGCRQGQAQRWALPLWTMPQLIAIELSGEATRGAARRRHLSVVPLFRRSSLTLSLRLRRCIRPLSAGLIWALRTSTRSVTSRWVWFSAPRRHISSVLDVDSSPSAVRQVGLLQHLACVQNLSSLPLCCLLPLLGAIPWYSSCHLTEWSSSQVLPWQSAALHSAQVASFLTYEAENAPTRPPIHLPDTLEHTCMCLVCLSCQCQSGIGCRLPAFGFCTAYPVGVLPTSSIRQGWQQLSASATDSLMRRTLSRLAGLPSLNLHNTAVSDTWAIRDVPCTAFHADTMHMVRVYSRCRGCYCRCRKCRHTEVLRCRRRRHRRRPRWRPIAILMQAVRSHLESRSLPFMPPGQSVSWAMPWMKWLRSYWLGFHLAVLRRLHSSCTMCPYHTCTAYTQDGPSQYASCRWVLCSWKAVSHCVSSWCLSSCSFCNTAVACCCPSIRLFLRAYSGPKSGGGTHTLRFH